MPNGLTEEQMVERMYTAMVGIDGNGGIVKDIVEAEKSRGKIHERINAVEESKVDKTECKTIRDNKESQKRSRWLVVKDVLLIVFGPAGGAVMVLIIQKMWG